MSCTDRLRTRRVARARTNVLPVLAIVLGVGGVLPVYADSIGIGFGSVHAAYVALSARPDAVVEDQAGWTRVGLPGPDGLTVWSFATREHPAFPVLVRRDVMMRNGVPTLVTRFLCEGRRAACETLYAQLRSDAEV